MIFLVISDEQNSEIRKIKIDFNKGMQQAIWDGRYELTSPINFNTPDFDNPYYEADKGAMAVPGKYVAQIVKVVNDKPENVTDKVAFTIKSLNNYALSPKDQQKQNALNKEIAEFRRVVLGSSDYLGHLKNRIKYLKAGLNQTNSNALALKKDISDFEKLQTELELKLYGDGSLAGREFETSPGFVGDMEQMVYYTWAQTYGSTGDMEAKFVELKNLFGTHYTKIKELKTLTEQIETKAEALKMPATYGRLPEWK
ncbi:MAG: hypothetical protein IPJ60_15395 [Sphingobacteriaceae bacterium]|nr:hypothetical protein [Sphingobacteriaceae bacterium]